MECITGRIPPCYFRKCGERVPGKKFQQILDHLSNWFGMKELELIFSVLVKRGIPVTLRSMFLNQVSMYFIFINPFTVFVFLSIIMISAV